MRTTVNTTRPRKTLELRPQQLEMLDAIFDRVAIGHVVYVGRIRELGLPILATGKLLEFFKANGYVLNISDDQYEPQEKK